MCLWNINEEHSKRRPRGRNTENRLLCSIMECLYMGLLVLDNILKESDWIEQKT